MLYRLENISKAYGPHEILRNATWQQNPGEKIGLVGRNGAGKTTLFRLLTGQDDPDHGRIVRASELQIGYLRQHLEAPEETTLFNYVLGAFGKVLEIERKMRELEHDLAEAADEDHGRLLDRYAALQHDYEHADGYTIHSEVERVLTGVGFGESSEWERPIGAFSGGQQNRAMLARVLLSPVDLLLLDEPTNHLDLAGIEFLEQFLAELDGSFVVISHDRTFLNRTVNEIVELAHGRLTEYPGNYEKFLELRRTRAEQMEGEWQRQQEMIDRTQDFIRRNLAGQKTKQAQSRRKMLEKLERVDRPQADETLAHFDLDAGPRSSSVALVADDLVAGYGENPVVGPFGIQIRRGERYAIVGPNGVGKSTLLKTLAGRLEPLDGEVRYGNNIQVGYYDQTLGDLRPKVRVLDEIWDFDHSKSEEEIRSYLARFSFSGDDVFKRVETLSGGERGRLALAKIMYVGGNLLLLDEPTNHLDVYTREALEGALERFTGVLIVVSHDRYFVDRIVDRIILIRDGQAELHYGNYSEVMERLARAEDSEEPVREQEWRRQGEGREPERNRGGRKERSRELRRIEQKIESTEGEISRLEKECESNELLLCSPEVYEDGEKVRAIQLENRRNRSELERLYREWDELTELKGE
ncbi:MAG: ABC-F family ATP-binding cassette domain-containing protein [Thermoanaerobaculia bacterium]|nr:ABC-F family ATP-binding cassette domain-containing protein [Thermoanaerobaculia bacterium]